MAVENRFTRIARRYRWLPDILRRRFVSWAIGRTIRFVGTAGLTVDALTPTQVIVTLPDRPRVQNHIGGLHAGAMALLAETATGLAVALNVSTESIPVIRQLNVSYERQAKGSLRATATLTDEQAQRIRSNAIGKLDVPVHVEDATGNAPITCEAQWAWLPRQRVLNR